VATSQKNRIKVLIIDDSALIRKVLTEILRSSSTIEVVGTAPDPFVAREKIKQLNPDVLTLDVEMPRMDGISFLSNIMRLRPMPVLMISSLTEKGADITLQALELGAVDFISKPKLDLEAGLKSYSEEIIEKIQTAAIANVRSRIVFDKTISEKHTADAILKLHKKRKHFKTTEKIIAIGASTGGTEAIKEILTALPMDSPGVVITQHIPESFSGPFAERMNRCSAMTVFEASNGQQILPGHVYIAPGNQHMVVERSGARYMIKLHEGPPVNRHRPSVDVMFRSISQNVGPNAIGILLTGMGTDGAIGLKEMRDTGAPTIIQDEKSSVVWGMPGEAFRLGAADTVKPLEEIPRQIIKTLQKMETLPLDSGNKSPRISSANK